ncbi:FAD:protein FMN transferase [Paraferrimonas sedimenticola]|uniref:FAD:protein FMN transferase n=1 Tax=Paraferrimonas sedimenticola TaxID=375674 RepID=A0AA37RXN7_9GAMM|nr:FAD:protein FMN transferase [Paraferrimonas sedimenticola]GLP97354.1 thiamin biosynthesis lipoprotein ApbE [Paraferrimonas sedimenticola]
MLLVRSISLCFVFCCLCLLSSTLNAADKRIELIQGKTMGSDYSVRYLATGEIPSQSEIHAGIEAEIEIVNQSMSTWRKHSEISQYNRSRSTEPVAMSREFVVVLKEAIRLAEITGGALDVTVGPLVNAWGFGEQGKRFTAPDYRAVMAANELVGIENIQLNGNSVRKTKPGTQINLSAIAKGYAVDRVADYMLAHGVKNFVVDIGGELRVHGQKSEHQPWPVVIGSPIESLANIELSVSDVGIATSGNYKQFYESDGQYIHHIMDPRAAGPVETKIISATVIHESCMTADGLATASFVLGSKFTLEMAEKYGLAILLIEQGDEGLVVHKSSAFQKFLKNQ